MEEEKLISLITRHIGGTASAVELEELKAYIGNDENEEEVLSALGKVVAQTGAKGAYDASRFDPLLKTILSADRIERPAEKSKRVFRLYPLSRWVAAAAIIVMISAGVYFYFSNKVPLKQDQRELAQTKRFKNDIAPAKQQVILTLKDGSKIILDSAANGTLASQGATKVVKKDGSVSYLDNNATEVFYNTVATEKGRTYHLRLTDGTEVWLDALSSLRFPTAFPGKEREVEITGQAYFEVAKNAKQPFKVKAAGEMVEVLGTHFNINTYNQQNLQTTLLEGSVKLIPTALKGEYVILKPGQQARVDNGGTIKMTSDIDVDEIMAWKNGIFQFNGSSVEEIMSQLSRWYDIEVVYQDKVPETFVAKISKDIPVSKLLALLEMTKQVKFTIEGKKITVMK